MKNVLLALFLDSVLTMPAFAASSNAGDKPMGVGNRHRHRDRPVVLDREHHHHHHDNDSR
jgi:hypothetical protein